MESIIERINQGKLWHFHGGIHPPEQKAVTSEKPIKHIPLPKQLVLPLQQHIGRQGDLLVKVGDKVLKGQALTHSSNPMAVPVHAPTSGIISAIKNSVIAHPSGLSELCLFIDTDGQDTWKTRNICQDFTQLSQQEIIKKISDAGIAGMGGAGFPTHIKVHPKPNVNFLIINAAECEPYITADDVLMREESEAIVDGIKILKQLLNPELILIGIEDNKPQAIKALQQATKHSQEIKVCVLPTKYPSGGEKQLIKILTGKEINSGTLPINSGIVVQNVATCYAIRDAVINDIPLIRRVVTLTGKALLKPQNFWSLLGTQVSYLLAQAGFINEVSEEILSPNESLANPPVIMGGPLMGFSILNEQVPIVKTSNCILAPSKIEMPSAFDNSSNEVECIRCGQCADVCPSQLLPQEMQWSAKAKDHQQLMKLNLFDCIDCGACAYVCPSQIPLVQYYRVAKAEIRQQQQLDIKSEKAKARFEARKFRLEQEKIARQEKHAKAAAARKATMNKKSADGGTASSAVAAALARVKAKKAAENNKIQSPLSSNEQLAGNDQVELSPVQAAIARAKAKRLAKDNSTTSLISDDKEQSSKSPLPHNKTDNTAIDMKKARIAAAVAKAKAKKAQANQSTTEAPALPQEAELRSTQSTAQSTDSEKPNSTTAAAEDKKARIAAAIAKAKAKKTQATQSTAEAPALPQEAELRSTQSTAQSIDSKKPNSTTAAVDDKKARIAAAVAKAKAKKAQANQSTAEAPALPQEAELRSTQSTAQSTDSEKPNSTTAAVDDKKARIAAAVAKAKAKAKIKTMDETKRSSTINSKEST